MDIELNLRPVDEEPKRSKLKFLFLIVIVILSVTVWMRFFILNQPKVWGYAKDVIDATEEPFQESMPSNKTVEIKAGGKKYTIHLKAKYKVAARVLSKKRYYFESSSKLSRYDLALGWGKLSDIASDKYIKYSQSNRWYYCRFSGNSPYDRGYISKHSANTHMIHSNNNILKALNKVKKNDILILSGYLVNVSGNNGFAWNTSLTRKDSGGGACEIMYVTEVRIGNTIYH